MANVSVRWRPSGGRGEYEFVPKETLADRLIHVEIEEFDVTFDSEVYGKIKNGKPRLRKKESNNRNKLHLPTLVIAIARLPEPRRELLKDEVFFPLDSKGYVLDKLDFEIVSDDGEIVVLRPLRMFVKNSDFEINLADRFAALRKDFEKLEKIRLYSPDLGFAIGEHIKLVKKGVNTSSLINTAQKIIEVQKKEFGQTNIGSATEIIYYNSLPEIVDEGVVLAKEGKILTRMHNYRERSKSLVKKAKVLFKTKNNGILFCEVCGLLPEEKYGEKVDSVIEAHHKVPISQLQPDTYMSANDLAMVCASCHRFIHSSSPCFTTKNAKERVDHQRNQ